jgi:hypothetical protein
MTEELDLDPYLDLLRTDFPSAKDETRLRQKLVGAGIGVSATFVTKTVAAATASLVKGGTAAKLSSWFVGLPLMAQLGIVTATTTVVATGPIWAVSHQLRPRSLPSVSNAPAATVASRIDPALAAPNRAAPAPAPAVAAASDQRSRSLVVGPTQTTSRSEPSARLARTEEARELAEEARLIDEALAAIRRGDLAQAEQRLDQHATRFEDARLAAERERARARLAEAKRATAP